MNQGIFDELTEANEPTESSESIADEPSSQGELPPQEQNVESDQTETETPTSETETEVREFTAKVGDREITYRIEGDIEDLDLEEVRLGHLRDRDYRHKTMEISNKSKGIDEHIAKLDDTARKLESQLLYEQEKFNTPEMQELKEYDEDEYNRRELEFNKRVKEYQAWQQNKQKEVEELSKQQTAAENQRIMDVLPEWKEETTRKQELESMIGYLRDQGYKDEEMGVFYSADYLPMVKKAMKYDEIVNKSLKSKKVNEPPKSTDPSASSDKDKPKSIEQLFYGG